MSLFSGKSKNEKPAATWFVAERGGHQSIAHHTREQAMNDFTAALIYAEHGAEGFTPYSRERRLVVTGPDWEMQPDDPDDPLLIGNVALAAVLTPAEYSLIVHGTVARALLES